MQFPGQILKLLSSKTLRQMRRPEHVKTYKKFEAFVKFGLSVFKLEWRLLVFNKLIKVGVKLELN